MSILQTTPPDSVAGGRSASADLPPEDALRTGMRMSMDEFERRSTLAEQRGSLERHEMIEGVVYVMPPSDNKYHASPGLRLGTLVGLYRLLTVGVDAGDAGGFRAASSWVGPDYWLKIGSADSKQTDLIGEAAAMAELCVEVSNSSLAYDLTKKRDLYQKHGVREYLVYDVRGGAILVFVRDEATGRLEQVDLDDGVFCSGVFPGLHLNLQAVVDGDGMAAHQTLMAAIDTDEHRAFVASLAEAGRQKESAEEST